MSSEHSLPSVLDFTSPDYLSNLDTCELRAEGSLFSNSVISSHLRELGYPEKSIISMNKCQEDTSVRIYGQDEIKDELRINTIRHWCCLRTCPYCAKKRQRAQRRKYIDYLKQLKITRKEFLYFLTISPQNYTDLSFGLKDIRKNYNKFIRLNYVKERIKGSLYVIEAKQSEDLTWNIHIHAIVYGRKLDNNIRGKCFDCGQNLMKHDHISKKYFCASRNCKSTNISVKNKNSKLTSEWKKSSNGQDVNMHITRQKTPSHTLNYMLKYIAAVKDNFKDEKGMAEYIVATRKTRLISTTGCFYGVKFNDYKTKEQKDKKYTYYMNDFELVSLRRDAGTNNPLKTRAEKSRILKKEKLKKETRNIVKKLLQAK